MMGSQSQLSIHSISTNQDRAEAEEYDLEDVLDPSCPVPVETPLYSIRSLFPVKSHTGSNNTSSSLFRNRGILKKNHFAYRNLSLESPNFCWKSSNLAHRAEHNLKRLNHDRKSSSCWTTRECSKEKDKFSKGPLDDLPLGGGEPTSNFHDDLIACPCCASHVLDKKGCERLLRGCKPRTGLLQTTMGDLEGINAGKGRNRRRSTMGHQPNFLKTKSIIDTLSELGPEVQQLADEPQYSPSRLHPSVRNVRCHPSAPTSDHDDTKTGPPLPLVSPDFQQYTEKIYDAVTRRPELQLSEGKNNPLLQYAKSGRVGHLSTKLPNSNGLGLRVEDSISRRKHRHLDQRSGRERGRTPDWIKRIFNVAKKGEIESLKLGVSDMEGTLVRNLSDHAGNNLLHVMAVFGHLESMAWLLNSQPVLIDGLQDENKFGLTPLVCAIKYGHLHLVQWLVGNTRAKEKVRCKDGERSFLHIGAKYAQEEIVVWLVDYMMTHEISLDNKDHHGNTALHLASRTGHSRICTILLQHGADVTLKNDLGQKAWEVCVIRGNLACAEYLCVHESGLALASDLTRREAELEAATTDNHDLKISFREIMSVARRLSREREEAVRELSRLHDQMVDAHDNIIMALQVLAEENSSLRERVNGIRQPQHPREHVESVIGFVTSLHEKWQSVRKKWFGSSFVNIKHRLLLVEESWKKLRHRSHRTVASTHHPLDIFRGKLCAIRAQGGEGRLGDLPSLCSSEESIASMFPFSDDEEDTEKMNEERSNNLPMSSTPARSSVAAALNQQTGNYNSRNLSQKDMTTRYVAELPPTPEDGCLELNQSQIEENIPLSFVDESITSSTEQNLSSVNCSSTIMEDTSRHYWSDPNGSLSMVSDLTSGERLPKDAINARLKALALTSESGSCSVLEVIEPSSEESDVLPEDDNADKPYPNAQESIQFLSRNSFDRRGKRCRTRVEEVVTADQVEVATSSSESGPECPTIHEQIGETIQTDSNHFLASETSSGTAAVGVSDCGRQRYHDAEEQEPDTAPVSSVAAIKRKGFLHKFIKPPRWSNKRKVKTLRKIESGSSSDFKDPYSLAEGRPNEGSFTIGDTDPHTTPESNTSSSHEYSNSSEESSIGKPTASRNDPSTSRTVSTEHNLNSNISFDQPSEKLLTPPLNTPPPIPSRRTIPSSPPPNRLKQNANRYHAQNSDPLKRSSEVRSVTASEDSGIVARPSSSASKTESLSRPESSSSSFPPFKSEFSLQKSNLSLTQDMLPTPDSSTAGRMSPAPSEVSKTESALSPPSHASDVSKSESSRQTSLGKASIESSTPSNCSKDGSAASSDYSIPILPLKKELAVKTAAIIDISCDQNSIRSLPADEPKEDDEATSKNERPWYEVSDEESDILLPDRLSSKVKPATSSSEEDVDIC